MQQKYEITYVLHIDVLFCTGLVQLNANLLCELLCIFCLHYLLLWTVILVSH